MKTSTILTFHSSQMATRLCVCYVQDGLGFDAFGEKYRVIVDDFGNVVFVGS